MTGRQRLTLLATIIGSGAVVLDSTVVNLALPKIALNLHASFADLQWIADAYLLTLSAFILIGGALGDLYGRKRMYLVGLVGFGIASLCCGLAPTATFLIITRMVQGLFGALLVPGALAIINTNFSANSRGAAIGTWSAWAAIFSPIGPLLGGYILDIASWRWIFLINVPLLTVCYILAHVNAEETREATTRRLDQTGAALAVIALAGITFGLIEGPVVHWKLGAWLPLVVGVISGIVFLRHERRAKNAMVQLSFFRSRNFSGANAATFAVYGALGGLLFAMVIYLQETMHFSSIAAGASTLPIPIFLLLLSRRFGALCAKYGPRRFMVAGPLLIGAGILSFIGLHPGMHYVSHILPGMLLFGFGMSLNVAPLTITVMGALDQRYSGIASAINNAVARVSGLILVAIIGILGTHEAFHFAVILCGCLALAGGVIAFLTIQNTDLKTVKAE